MLPYLTSTVFLATSLALIMASHFLEIKVISLICRLAGYSLLGFFAYVLCLQSLIDTFSMLVGTIFIAISFLISLYTSEYIVITGYERALGIFMDLFLIALISAYIAPTLLLFVVAWTISEILGFVIIKKGEEHSTEGPLTSSRGFIFTSTLTYELSVFTLITLSMVLAAASVGLAMLNTPFNAIRFSIDIPLFLMPLILVGFITKMANAPLHFWLPSAHSSAPSPGSAALSGIMVSLGYYGLYRVLNLVSINKYKELLAYVFLFLGTLTLLYGGLQSVNQRDVKKLLAYSTIATNGYISLLFAMYVYEPSEITLWTLLLGIIMHAAYKSTLFCEAGLVEIAYGTRYVHGIRGVVNVSSISTIGGIIATLSLLGLPGTVGFASKLLSVLTAVMLVKISIVFATITIISLVVYIALSALIALGYARIYFGTSMSKIFANIKTPPRSIQLPVLLLGLTNVVFVIPALLLLNVQVGLILAIMTLFSFFVLYVVYNYFKVVSTGILHGHGLH